MSTAKGEETRRRIVWAAWELSTRRGIEQLLCGVSLREVAARAEVSPSSVTYHFATMADLALAMVEELVDSLSPQPAGSVEEAFGSADPEFAIDTVREAAAANWAVMTSADELVFEERLLRCYSAVGAPLHGPAVRRHLARFNRLWVERMTAVYEQFCAEAMMRPVDPLDVGDLARIMQVFTEGLLHHWMCDPSSVRVDLIEDVAAAVASILITPNETAISLDELSTRLLSGSPGSAPRGSEDALVAAGSVAELFGSGTEKVTLTEIADALGWSPEEVLRRLGSVRRVAALCFARHLPSVEAAAARRGDADASLALSDATFELARRVQGDPWCALALLFERLESRADVADSGRGSDVDDLVPLDRIFGDLVDAVDGDQCLERDSAAMLVDSVLANGGSRPRASLITIVEPAIRLVTPRLADEPVGGRREGGRR